MLRLFTIFSLLWITAKQSAFSQETWPRCLSAERKSEYLEANPAWIVKRNELEKQTAEFVQKFSAATHMRSVITIPVVVHIIWNKNEENISDQQVLSQLAILNKDFRMKNVEVAAIPTVFQSLIADVEFEFCLAVRDPNDNPTTGITRTWTPNSAGIGSSRNIFYTSKGGRDVWDTKKYLNIYVARFSGSISGIASFPESGPASEDAVVINYLNFGNINSPPPYHLGRTATHEIGHYFNLEHPWGPKANDCCADDFVHDTPPACDTYLDKCPTHPVVSCSTPDLFMNYMFYTDDSCMGMFTNGQKLRMLAALNGPRNGLLSSMGCETTPTTDMVNEASVRVYPNPFSDHLIIEIMDSDSKTWHVTLLNPMGRVMFEGQASSETAVQIPSTQLPGGIYFLHISNGEIYLAKRIVKT